MVALKRNLKTEASAYIRLAIATTSLMEVQSTKYLKALTYQVPTRAAMLLSLMHMIVKYGLSASGTACLQTRRR
jgi:hypothetical protein